MQCSDKEDEMEKTSQDEKDWFVTMSDGTGRHTIYHAQRNRSTWDKVKDIAEMVVSMTPTGKAVLTVIWIVAFFLGMAAGLYMN